MNYTIGIALIVFGLLSCQSKEVHDIIFFNAEIYTAEGEKETIDAVAVNNGIISAIAPKMIYLNYLMMPQRK